MPLQGSSNFFSDPSPSSNSRDESDGVAGAGPGSKAQRVGDEMILGRNTESESDLSRKRLERLRYRVPVHGVCILAEF